MAGLGVAICSYYYAGDISVDNQLLHYILPDQR